MKLHDYEKEQDKMFRKRLLIVLITVVVTAVSFPVLKNTLGFADVNSGLYESALAKIEAAKTSDSVELSGGKVSVYDFENEYNADNWFRAFQANKIAFDNQFADKTIDVYGEIKEVSEFLGCSKIILKVSVGGREITCSNCPRDVDGWRDEVLKTTVGQYVHIRGVYSEMLSDKYSLNLLECHIQPYSY